LIGSLLRGAAIALYLTVAFAVVPALGTASEATSPEASRPFAEGVLVATAVLAITIGTALTRWMREETPL
jgi:preprotein translocase subunit SecY